MIKIDLITGFLGSGKTTFIRRYADYLTKCGYKICILENDFGAVNVDMMLLQDLLSASCDLEMVSGAYDKDCHKRRFKTKLISMAMRGFDRVIIEPSGIYDIDEFFDTLREEPLDNWYEIGNIIAVCDAGLDENMSQTAEYMLASQIANAGKVVFSRCQQTSKDEIQSTIKHIERVIKKLGCEFKQESIFCKDWSELSDEDFKMLSQCAYVVGSYEKMWLDEKKAFNSLYFMNISLAEDKLREKIDTLLNDESYGNIFRIKGFMRQADEKWIEINATHKAVTIQPIEKGQEVFIIIGENLDEDKIKSLWNE